MSNEENFLIIYGLHGFVTCTPHNGCPAFTIGAQQSPDMIHHAQTLITETFGPRTTVHVH